MGRHQILTSFRERILAFGTSRVSRDQEEDLTQPFIGVIESQEKGPPPEKRAALSDHWNVIRTIYWLMEMRSLIKSNVSLETTFLATNSPFTR